MGTRYTTQSISGYNATPPSDDGTVASSNQVSWAKHLSKIGNPLKTLAEAINTQLVAALATTCRTITANDSIVAGDHWRTVQIGSTVTSAITVTLADATTMANGFIVTIANQSNVAHTIGRATASNTIDNVTANATIPALSAITFIVNSAASGYMRVASESPGGWVLLASQTASSSATIDFAANSAAPGFDDIYDKYMVCFDNVKPATDNVYFGLRIGSGAGPTWQSGGGAYSWGLSYVGAGGTPAGEGSSGTGIATLIPFTPTGGNGVGNASGEQITGVVEYSNPETTDLPIFLARSGWINASGLSLNSQSSGNYGSAAAITGVRFLFSSGNIASGTFRLYGLRK